MVEIVMREDSFLGAAGPNPGDRRSMVFLVRENYRALQELNERGECGLVRNIARGKKKSRFLAMQVCKFSFQFNVIMGGSRNIARSARPGASEVDRLMHGAQNSGMLTHSKIVIRTPDRYRPFSVGSVMERVRKLTSVSKNICKDTITSLKRQCIESLPKCPLVVHHCSSLAGAALAGAPRDRAGT